MDVRPLSKWMVPFFQKGLERWEVFEKRDLDQAVLRFWCGRMSKEYYPPRGHNEWLKSKLERSAILKYRARAKVGKRLEGPTEVDLVIETPKMLIFIEAKYLSDIDCQTTYDPCRDQIIRNLDVGTYQAETRDKQFFFILLTPEFHERSRLYWFKMVDYMRDPNRIKEKLPYRSINFEQLSANIMWILWRDVIQIWHANKEEFQVEGEDRMKVPLVSKHFEEAGLC